MNRRIDPRKIEGRYVEISDIESDRGRLQSDRNDEIETIGRVKRSRTLRLLLPVIALAALFAVACETGAATVDVSSLNERQFPAELMDEAEPLAPGDVVSAYIGYFSGARLAPRDAAGSGQTTAITDYCPDFTGQVILSPPITGSTFFWNVAKSDDLAWNEALLVVDFIDPNVPTLLGQAEGSPVSIRWSPDTLESTVAFRSPDCGR